MFNKENFYRYLVSTLVTFLTGFIGTAVMMFEASQGWGDLSLKALMLGASFAGVRLVLKLVSELLPKYKA
jgi:hypothetical protein|tara:strand:- start:5488 stop:5697 length:210 start_codon:yes stop_codon:yes gene_type:complete